MAAARGDSAPSERLSRTFLSDLKPFACTNAVSFALLPAFARAGQRHDAALKRVAQRGRCRLLFIFGVKHVLETSPLILRKYIYTGYPVDLTHISISRRSRESKLFLWDRS